MMKLLVGLGNPGDGYAMNRHNVGFMAVDRIHDRWNGGPWRRKFQGEVAEATVGGARVMFLKPMTFMNESGRAVAEAARFYKVDLGDIVVAHDEIDLPPGKFRMKTGGGTGGHNGLKSICAHMRDGYRRLRIGVGHPGRKEMVPSYVLKDFPKADYEWLEPMLDAFAEEAPLLVAGQDSAFASKVHERLSGSSVGPKKTDTPAPAEAQPAPPAAQKPGGPFSALAQLLRK
jgi:PTH1 family peptidyl-tRNA hydrolase